MCVFHQPQTNSPDQAEKGEEVRFVKGLIDRKMKQLEEQRSQVQDLFNRDFVIKVVLDYHGKVVPSSNIIWRKIKVSGGMTLANFADKVLLRSYPALHRFYVVVYWI